MAIKQGVRSEAQTAIYEKCIEIRGVWVNGLSCHECHNGAPLIPGDVQDLILFYTGRETGCIYQELWVDDEDNYAIGSYLAFLDFVVSQLPDFEATSEVPHHRVLAGRTLTAMQPLLDSLWATYHAAVHGTPDMHTCALLHDGKHVSLGAPHPDYDLELDPVRQYRSELGGSIGSCGLQQDQLRDYFDPKLPAVPWCLSTYNSTMQTEVIQGTMCIRKEEISCVHAYPLLEHFGEFVQLKGLGNRKYNNVLAILGGYDPITDRLIVWPIKTSSKSKQEQIKVQVMKVEKLQPYDLFPTGESTISRDIAELAARLQTGE